MLYHFICKIYKHVKTNKQKKIKTNQKPHNPVTRKHLIWPKKDLLAFFFFNIAVTHVLFP